MNIYVIGIGRIGLVTACCLANSGHMVTGVENDRNKFAALNSGRSPIFEQDIQDILNKTRSDGRLKFTDSIPDKLSADSVFVTVNTPSLNDGNLDMSQVYEVVGKIVKSSTNPLMIIMKSTVPPGIGEKIIDNFIGGTKNVYVSCPEFLRTGEAVYDWYHPSRMVVGLKDISAFDEVKKIFKGINAPWVITDITSAEIVKLASNGFLATKISFINQIADICEQFGANIDDVAQGMGLDQRIGSSFLKAGLGFGGPCLYKDTKMLGNTISIKDKNIKATLIEGVIEINSSRPSLIVKKLKQFIKPTKGKKIGLLGLTFKPNTNDTMNSPALEIAKRLVEEGAILQIYDPGIDKDHLPEFGSSSVKLLKNIYLAASSVNAIIISTEWAEFKEANWSLIKQKMSNPHLVIDGRNYLDQNMIEKLGFRYVGMGRKIA
jgi:UDPglucose 6-dehydrogenase